MSTDPPTDGRPDFGPGIIVTPNPNGGWDVEIVGDDEDEEE